MSWATNWPKNGQPPRPRVVVVVGIVVAAVAGPARDAEHVQTPPRRAEQPRQVGEQPAVATAVAIGASTMRAGARQWSRAAVSTQAHLGRRGHVGQPRERRLHVGLGELRVLERAGQVGVVGRRGRSGRGRRGRTGSPAPRRPRLAASASSITARIACAGSGAGMIPSVRANCTRRLERLVLLVGARLDEPGLDEPAQHRRVAVVAQAAGVHGRRHEVVAERVHRHQRRQPDRVAEVVAVDAAGRASGRPPARRRRSASSRSPRSTRRRNGNARPAKFEPPPTQPIDHVGLVAGHAPSARSPPGRSPSGAAARG